MGERTPRGAHTSPGSRTVLVHHVCNTHCLAATLELRVRSDQREHFRFLDPRGPPCPPCAPETSLFSSLPWTCSSKGVRSEVAPTPFAFSSPHVVRSRIRGSAQHKVPPPSLRWNLGEDRVEGWCHSSPLRLDPQGGWHATILQTSLLLIFDHSPNLVHRLDLDSRSLVLPR